VEKCNVLPQYLVPLTQLEILIALIHLQSQMFHQAWDKNFYDSFHKSEHIMILRMQSHKPFAMEDYGQFN
jgi:hypothetical protein